VYVAFPDLMEDISLIIFIGFSDWDLTLVSADGVTFNVHRKNLSAHSTIFADADGISTLSTEPEVVLLTETADVLGLLLKFMYRQAPPIFNDVCFATIADLAKAAEKYEIVAAMHTIEKNMKYVHGRNIM
jgi:hypothetical protein